MSNITTNANRYNAGNTFRSDSTGGTRGNIRGSNGAAIGFDCSGLVYHILRESGYNVPYATSGAMIDNKTVLGDWATAVSPAEAIKPGTLVYFNGHVGIVQSYDPVAKTGKFLSMTGHDNSGELKPNELFTTDATANPNIYWGGTKGFKGFAEVKAELYDRTLDQHANGANSNTPVFNIPEATNSGFITLPGNGGFPTVKGAADLSGRIDIAAASSGVAPPPPIDFPNANTAFAIALATLESLGQPNNGYGAWYKDGQNIGAIGRYGFRASSLKAIGWMDASGNWTDKARANGVTSPESFRDNPEAQEEARVEYMGTLKNELKNNGSWGMIGETVNGHVITEAGLIAAAWNQGAFTVRKLLSGDDLKTGVDTQIMLRLDRFANCLLPSETAVQANASASGTPSLNNSGHWEDHTQYDVMTGLPIGPRNEVWVADAPRADGAGAVTPSSSSPSIVASPASVRPAVNRDITRHEDGSTTFSSIARAASTDGTIQAGDLVTQVFDADGTRIYYSVSHTERGETTLMESVPNAANGEAAVTFSKWTSSGLEFQGQWDAFGDRVGEHYTVGGVTYTRSTEVTGDGVQVRWLDPNGLDADARAQQSFDQEAQRLIQRAEELDEPVQPGLAVPVDDLVDIERDYTDAGSSADGEQGGEDGGGEDGGGDAGISDYADQPTFRQGEIAQQNEDALNARRVADTAAAVGLMNSIIGLQNWEQMTDLQRLAAVTSIYNVLDNLHKQGGLGGLPGDLGATAGVLSLLSALEQGNIGSAIYSGLYLVESLTAHVGGLATSGLVSETLGGDFLPALGFVLALSSGNPVAIASSGLSLMSSLGMIGPWGAAAAVVVTLLGSILSDHDIPTREGQAHAQWDAQGHTVVITDRDEEGGGAAATGWMQSLVDGMQAQLGQSRDASGKPLYEIVPDLLPAIGYTYDPDGLNYMAAQGHLYLRWLDDNGVQQTRYYDGAGNRADGSGETLAGDFMAHAAAAIAPAWAVETARAHFLGGGGIHLPNHDAGLPEVLADGLHQTLHILTLNIGATSGPASALVDVDGDGYLEQTQWVQANQAVLAIDANGDGVIGAGEFVSLEGRNALNSLGWLDANGDHILDASDPAFAALRLWIDANGDGVSRNAGADESRSLAQAGIVAIDFSVHPPAVVRADGSRSALTAQTLTSDVLGVAFAAVAGGILEMDEQASGAAIVTLHAANTRAFDGQAEHTHGGDVDTDGFEGGTVTIGAHDGRLSSTSGNTLTNQSEQNRITVTSGDANLQDGEAGTVQAGQAPGQTTPSTLSAGTTTTKSNGTVFVPAGTGTTSAAQASRQATQAMVESATPELSGPGGLLTAFALGLALTDWPALVSAEESESNTQGATGGATPPTTWTAWDGVQGEGGGAGGAAPNSSSPVPPSANPGSDAASHAFHASQASPASSWSDLAQDGASTAIWPSASSASGSTTTMPGPASPDASALAATTQVLADPIASAPTAAATSPLIDFPKTEGEHAPGREDTGLRFASSLLLANDSTANAPRPGEPALRITSVFAPVHGSVSLQMGEDGQAEVAFLPEADYHGPASFSYTVTDSYGLSSTASVSLQVAAVNDAPTAQGESASGSEDRALQFTAASLLANDHDVDTAVDGDVLRVTRVGAAVHGQVFLLPDGTVRFEPDADYNGPAQFSYWVGDRDPADIANGEGFEVPATVQLTILPVNDLPVVTGEAIASDEDVVLDIDPALLLANDFDVDTAGVAINNSGQPPQVLHITAVGNAQHGSIALLPDGTLRFTPESDYFGAASFSYTVDDGAGGQVTGTAVVNLAPVNDAPIVIGETVSFDEDTVQTLTQAQLLANDLDVDNPHADLRIVSVDNASHGSVALNPDGSIRFVPEADYFGTAHFTYTVSDGAGGFTVGMASLEIAPVNDAPRLTGEVITLDEDTQLQLSAATLLANDSDVDNPHADLAIASVGHASHGTVSLVDGQIVFTPDLNFYGQASFTYTVSDGAGGWSEATVQLSFNPVNDAPVANGELLWGKRDVSYTLSAAALLANDTDAESPSELRITAIANVQHGTAVLNPDGSVHFTPEPGFSGRGSFDYVVSDPDGASATATAQIDFSRVNTNPIAVDDSFIGYEDIAFVIQANQLLVNDSDPDGISPAPGATTLTLDAVRNASHGSVSLQPDGSVRFMPDADYHGTASFEYCTSDGEGGTAWATAFLTVQSVNDAPVIEDIWYGSPIYGYSSYLDGNLQEVVYAIGTEADALAHQNAGTLFDAQHHPVTFSYYMNGAMRPIAFSDIDAFIPQRSTGHGNDINPPTHLDDPAREHGRVIAYDPDGDSASITISIAQGPQHGHAWTNAVTPNAAMPGLTHEQAPGTFTADAGAWQYYGHLGDGYIGADPFSILVTDGDGASTTVTIQTSHVQPDPFMPLMPQTPSTAPSFLLPIVLDLNGDGINLIAAADSNVRIDANGDGSLERMGWADNDDGVLVFDINRDGRVDYNTEISFAGYRPGARTDLEGLAAFDTDGDGRLTASDAAWGQFGVLRDANGNGLQDEGEFLTLDALGISAIGLQRQGSAFLDHGNIVFGTASVEFTDGHTSLAGDVMFVGEGPTGQATAQGQQRASASVDAPSTSADAAANDAHGVVASSVQSSAAIPPSPAALPDFAAEADLLMQARVNHVALAFNQAFNSLSAPASSNEPLGFVDWRLVQRDQEDGAIGDVACGWTASSFTHSHREAA